MVKAGFASGAGEQTIVADALKALRQDMEQEATDELVGSQRHDLLPIGAVGPVVLVAEGDAGLVEAEESAVREFGEKLQALGVTIANSEPDESTHKDRRLLTGASPLAANALGKLAAETLLGEMKAETPLVEVAAT